MTVAVDTARRAVGGSGWTLASALVLAVWIGAGLFFTAVVAPAAFRALPTRALAGALVGRVLPVLFAVGIVAGIAVALIALAEPAAAWGRLGRLVSGVLIAALCAVGQFVIGGRIERLRASLGTTLDSLPTGDPGRVAFGRLHGLSVLTLGTAGIIALLALLAAIIALHAGAPRE